MNKVNYNTSWLLISEYLLEAIQLYTPYQELASRIAIELSFSTWNSVVESILKLLLPLIDSNLFDMESHQYSHLIPQITPQYNEIGIVNACIHNNIEGIKHRLKYRNPNEINLYEAIIAPIDNRECLELILPLLTSKVCGNTYIISAYVNNKLPDYTIPKYDNNITMRAIYCHFTGDNNLENTIWNDSLLYIAYKFGFNAVLLRNCIDAAVMNNYDISKLPDVVRDYISKSCYGTYIT